MTSAANDNSQSTPLYVKLAEYGSLSLEFTRLSQLTGDPKYFDAIQRITDVFNREQNKTQIPGLWPVKLNAQKLDFSKDNEFTLGALADSHYEYLPKMHLLLGGRTDQYQRMYTDVLAAAKERLFFRPINPQNQDLLMTGHIMGSSRFNTKLHHETQHLACFAGGMVGLAAKAFREDFDLHTARQLVDGCIWAYESMPTGIMPEVFSARGCKDRHSCEWTEGAWHQGVRELHGAGSSRPINAELVIKNLHLAPGFTGIRDARYLLRPEAIESIFVMYRITADRRLLETAWRMFQAIESRTKTSIAYATIKDVSVQQTTLDDSMESFWTAETLKYFYLMFSEPDVISLDEYVLNTEAHPLLRPKDWA